MHFLLMLANKLDAFYVKLTSKNSTPEYIERKILERRRQREEIAARKMQEYEVKKQERARIAEEKKEQEKQEVMAILNQVVKIDELNYTAYEYNEVRRNRSFFRAVEQRVFESGEQGLTFIACEFDKSSKKEFNGYLFVTNKRVFFIERRLQNLHKFRYQTIINVSWFHDGLLEKGLHIQYGSRRLEFDEIFDHEQMKRVGNLILRLSRR